MGGYDCAARTGAIEPLGFGSDDATLAEIDARFREPIVWKPYPDAVDGLRKFRAAGHRIGIGATFSHELPEILQRVGLAEYLDSVTYSFEVGAEKPHPRIFRTAAIRAGIAPEPAVHVGDSYEADYLGARRAGLHAILLCRDSAPPAPCPSIPSLEALPALLGCPRSRA